MSNQLTPIQAWYQAEQQAARVNEVFLFLVKEGMTREELSACIERSPGLWGRLSNWLTVLPSGNNHDKATVDLALASYAHLVEEGERITTTEWAERIMRSYDMVGRSLAVYREVEKLGGIIMIERVEGEVRLVDTRLD